VEAEFLALLALEVVVAVILYFLLLPQQAVEVAVQIQFKCRVEVVVLEVAQTQTEALLLGQVQQGKAITEGLVMAWVVITVVAGAELLR
jgi:hypothetical protein